MAPNAVKKPLFCISTDRCRTSLAVSSDHHHRWTWQWQRALRTSQAVHGLGARRCHSNHLRHLLPPRNRIIASMAALTPMAAPATVKPSACRFTA